MATITTGPENLDWTVYVGDRNRETFEYLSDGDPVDLTGAVLAAQARASAISEAVSIEAVAEIIDPGAGTFALEWDGEQLRALVAREQKWTGVWDLEVTADGETLPRTLLAGTFTAVHDVTRQEP